MAALFNLKIIACDGVFYDGDSEIIIFQGGDGQAAIMANHEQMTGVVEIGQIRFKKADGTWQEAVISDGLISV